MSKRVPVAEVALTMLAVLIVASASAQTHKDLNFSAAPGTTLTIVNENGPITVHPGNGRQVTITVATHSDKVDVEQAQAGNRIQLRTRLLQPKLANDQSLVEYNVTAPADIMLNLRSSTGPVKVERMQGDMDVQGDTAQIEVRDINGGGHVHVRTMAGPVRLAKITNGHVEVTSVSGTVDMSNVTGPHVEANTTNGKITYAGGFDGGGEYAFTNHAADIDVSLPATASVDVSARSIKGAVQNDFPFQQKPQTAASAQGRAFAGTSNAGSSSVQLRSFSGTIRVKKL